MNEHDFYREKLAEIKDLITKKHYQNALSQINTELAMPYLPRNFELELRNLLKELRLQDEAGSTPRRIGIDEVASLLQSDVEADLVIAMEALPALNLHLLTNEIDSFYKRFKNSKQIEKSYIFELLIAQKVNIDLLVGNQKHNPTSFLSPLGSAEVLAIFNNLSQELSKTPNIQEAAEMLFYKFILLNYFKSPLFEDGFATDFLQVVRHFFDMATPLHSSYQQYIFEILSKV